MQVLTTKRRRNCCWRLYASDKTETKHS